VQDCVVWEVLFQADKTTDKDTNEE